MSHLKIYTQTNYQSRNKTKYIFRQDLKVTFHIFVLFLKLSTKIDRLHGRQTSPKQGSKQKSRKSLEPKERKEIPNIMIKASSRSTTVQQTLENHQKNQTRLE